MKFVVLMAVFILYQIPPGHSSDMYLPCNSGEVYYTCEDFCKWGCNMGNEMCLYRCKLGCGCGRRSLIQTDGPQCRLLRSCK